MPGNGGVRISEQYLTLVRKTFAAAVYNKSR